MRLKFKQSAYAYIHTPSTYPGFLDEIPLVLSLCSTVSPGASTVTLSQPLGCLCTQIRMSLCLVCQDTAVFFCQNDGAHLCASCDISIHSCNEIAARHIRVPICEDGLNKVRVLERKRPSLTSRYAGPDCVDFCSWPILSVQECRGHFGPIDHVIRSLVIPDRLKMPLVTPGAQSGGGRVA